MTQRYSAAISSSLSAGASRHLMGMLFCLFLWNPVVAAGEVPVEAGTWYEFWYDTPVNRFAGAKERRVVVKVIELKGTWAKVDLVYEHRVGRFLALIDVISKDEALMDSFVKEVGTTKEEFLEKLGEIPRTPREQRTVWINLDRLEAITEVELPTPEEMGGRRKDQEGND